MTVEELLKPRYKVIADYPRIGEDNLKVGDIFSMPDYEDDFTKEYWLKMNDKYPHLFKKLEWWEEREEDEMPEYIKWQKFSFIDVFTVAKIDRYAINKYEELYAETPESFTGKIFLRNANALPATKEEYEQYLKEQKAQVSNTIESPLTECMIGRDAECNHPKCPVTDEDCKNGKYCTLPLYDWRQ